LESDLIAALDPAQLADDEGPVGDGDRAPGSDEVGIRVVEIEP
jgi:hypothetical protein